MAKQSLLIEETQTQDFNFASNPTLLNVGTSPIYVLTPDEEKTVDGLDLPTRNQVMGAMYAILPGGSRVIGKGVYRVILGVNGRGYLSYGGKIQTPKDDDETQPTTPANDSNDQNQSNDQSQSDDSNDQNQSNDQTQTAPEA